MDKLYYMLKKATPAKIEVGTVNHAKVIMPIAHFVWEEDDKYEWTPDLVIASTGWGLFNAHPEFMAKLSTLNGIVLKPDMMAAKLEGMGLVKLEAADYGEDFSVSVVFPHPDRIGSSEYRAIYEVLEDAAEDWEDARATLEEFKEQAESMLKTLNERDPDVGV